MPLTLAPARSSTTRREAAATPQPPAPAPVELLDEVDEWGRQSFPASDPPPTW